MADTTNYKELGLVNTKNMFKQAMEGRYAIPAYNFKVKHKNENVLGSSGKA